MDELVTVFETSDEIDEAIYRGLLEEAGIPVVSLDHRNPHVAYGMYEQSNLPRFSLQVPRGQADAAARLVESYREEVERSRPAPTATEETPEDEPGQGGGCSMRLAVAVFVVVLVLLAARFGIITRFFSWIAERW